jgi:hypothetical protein
MQTERRRPGFHSLRTALYKLPAVISSTFLFSLFFAPLRGKSFLASGRSTLFLWPQKKHKIHKNSYNFSLSVFRLPPRSPPLFCVFLCFFAAIILPATSNPATRTLRRSGAERRRITFLLPTSYFLLPTSSF